MMTEQDFKNLKLSEVRGDVRISTDDLRRIRQAKRKEIEKALDILFLIKIATYIYRESKEPDFDLFLNEFCEATWRYMGDQHLVEFYSRGEEAAKNILSEATAAILSIDYSPPTSLRKISDHLWVLWLFYDQLGGDPPSLLEMRLDFALCKLMASITMSYPKLMFKGRDLSKAKKMFEKVSKKRSELKDRVQHIFYQMDTAGMTFHKIAKEIEKRLIKSGFYPQQKPDEKRKDYSKTIKRYLLSDDNIRADLINLGVIKGQK